MKTLGLIGGLSWESTREYYRLLNELVRERLGKLHSAKCVLYSFDFQEMESLMRKESWSEISQKLIEAGMSLERAGAESILICSNTMHFSAKELEQALHVPLLHIANPIGTETKKHRMKSVALLGTKFAMEKGYYQDYLEENFQLQTTIPNEEERDFIHKVIFDELCNGVFREESKAKFSKIVDRLAANGAQGVILGCTEIEQLLKPEDCLVPAFATTALHARAAVDWALN